MSDVVREQMLAQLAGLSEDQQRRVLEFARSLVSPDGIAGGDLLRFAGAIEKICKRCRRLSKRAARRSTRMNGRVLLDTNVVIALFVQR
jgi:hypothetical protein